MTQEEFVAGFNIVATDTGWAVVAVLVLYLAWRTYRMFTRELQQPVSRGGPIQTTDSMKPDEPRLETIRERYNAERRKELDKRLEARRSRVPSSTCTRSAGHDGPCNGVPSPTCTHFWE